MTNHPTKKIYGLIGFPVKHSFSPKMHNAAFKELGIDAEYRLFELKENEFDNFFKKTIKEANIWGFNVTVPYKEKVLKYITGGFSSGVEAIGAVNTVRRQEDNSLVGFNTDWAGFSKDLLEKGFNVEGKRVSILGAGGVARAVVFALREAAAVFIYDIDKGKCEKLLEDMYNDKDFDTELNRVDSAENLPIQDCDLLVNATAVGMKPEDGMVINTNKLHKDLFVYDVIYNPQETKLLKVAKEKGLKYANGIGMLLYQGVLAFQHWTKKDAPIEVMRRALAEELR